MPGGPVMDEDGLAVQSTGEPTRLGFYYIVNFKLLKGRFLFGW